MLNLLNFVGQPCHGGTVASQPWPCRPGLGGQDPETRADPVVWRSGSRSRPWRRTFFPYGRRSRCHRTSVGQSTSPSLLPQFPTRYAVAPAGATTPSLDLALATPPPQYRALGSGRRPLIPCHAPKRGTLSHRWKTRSPRNTFNPPYLNARSAPDIKKFAYTVNVLWGNPGLRQPPLAGAQAKKFQTDFRPGEGPAMARQPREHPHPCFHDTRKKALHALWGVSVPHF